MKRLILSWFFLLCALSISAQSTVHLDKPYYLAGEEVFYSFCNHEIDRDSATVQVRLYDNAKIVDSYFLAVVGKCGEGHLKLPYQSTTGMYFLEVRLFISEQFVPTTLVRVPITIYNDEDLSSLDGQLAKSRPQIDPSPSGNQSVEILHAQPLAVYPFTYNLEEGLRDRVARVSLSVRDNTIYGDKRNTVHLRTPLLPVQDAQWGIPFAGKRINSVESEIRNPLLFALNAENLCYDATEVDLSTKEFIMPLTPFYATKKINFLDYLDDSVRVEQMAEQPRPVVPETYAVDSLVIEHLRIYREEKTINQVFQQISLPLQEDSTDLNTLPMEPNYEADVQDFAIRGTTVTLFKELIAPLKFRSIGKGRYRARMLYERNNIKKYYSRPPLFIVNGRATRNGPQIAEFPLQEIKYFKIYSLYDDLEQISPMAFGGIVFVDMMDPNYVLSDRFAQPAFPVQGMQLPISYPVGPSFSEESPTVGSLLHWDPNVTIENGTIKSDIKTLETNAEYVIEVVIHLKDSDEPIVHREVLQVRSGEN